MLPGTGDVTALRILAAAGEELAGLAQILIARGGPRPQPAAAAMSLAA